MSQATFTVQTAINESIAEDRIVHLEFTGKGQGFDEVTAELAERAEDSVVHRPDNDGPIIHEYWGTDEEGDEWRVHVEAI